MSWLDKFFTGVLFVQNAGVTLPQRPTIDFAGGLTATDDPANNRTIVAAASSGTAGMPTRGLTSLIFADEGPFNNSGNVNDWYDQAPARPGQFWNTDISSSTAGTYNASGFNGKITVDTGENPSFPSYYQAQYINGLNLTARSFVAPEEFTLSACLQYTGTINYSAPVYNTALCPQPWGTVRPASGFPEGCGILCGLDPGNANNVIFAAYVCVFNTSLSFVQSISVPKNVPHYLLVTFTGGVLSLYLDSNAVVTQGGCAPMVEADLAAAVWTTSGTGSGSITKAHNRLFSTSEVAMNASEVTQALAYLASSTVLGP